jgi:hypothetical protein
MDKLRQILYGIDKYSNKIQKFLSEYGDKKIVDIYVYRKPIQKILNYYLNLASSLQIIKNLKESNYDDIFHLFMIVKCDNGEYVLIEKNDILNINLINIDAINNAENVEKIKINYMSYVLSINDLLNNTLKNIVEYEFFNYNSLNLNCQKFILDILRSNKLYNEKDKNFIYQNPYKIYNKTGLLSYINKKITDLSASIKIIKGEGINDKIDKNYELIYVYTNDKFFKNNKNELLKNLDKLDINIKDYYKQIKDNKIKYLFNKNTNINYDKNDYFVKSFNNNDINFYFFKKI